MDPISALTLILVAANLILDLVTIYYVKKEIEEIKQELKHGFFASISDLAKTVVGPLFSALLGGKK